MFSSVFLFLNIGTQELVLIMFVALMLFGGDKLPGIARGLGKGIRDFKDASEGVKREINNQINNYEEKKPEPPVIEEKKAEQLLIEEKKAEQLLIEEKKAETPQLTPHENAVPLADHYNSEGTEHVAEHGETEIKNVTPGSGIDLTKKTQE